MDMISDNDHPGKETHAADCPYVCLDSAAQAITMSIHIGMNINAEGAKPPS